MPVERVFLDPAIPPVVAAAQWLLDHVADGSGDLRRVLVGVPAARAATRLTERLVAVAQDTGVPLRPPTVLSAEVLANRLVPSDPPIVPQPLRLLAWVRALREVAPQILDPLTPHRAADDDAVAWAALAGAIESVHTELSAGGLRFGDVPAKGAALADFTDGPRWAALAEVYEAYLGVLDEWHHADPGEARLQALADGVRPVGGPVVLACVTDLSPVLAGLLASLRDPVTALVSAGGADADCFDGWGRPDPAAWAKAPIAVRDGAIRVVEDPADQADAVLDAIADLEGSEPASSIAIGLADPALGPVVGQHLAAAGLSLADPHARPLARSGPCRLLEVVAALLEEQRFEDLLALVRHPDIEGWLGRRVGEQHDHAALLEAVDRVGVERLPARWTPSELWPEEAEAAMAVLASWLETLGGGRRAITQWVRPVLAAVAEVYRGRSLDVEVPGDAETLAALATLRESALAWLAIPSGDALFRVSAAEAIGLMLRSIGQRFADPAPHPPALEAYRWIELALDDSPVVIVAGLNEGSVPRSHGADAFIPERLRTALSLADSAARYAQDAHALTVLLATRQRVSLIAGRRGGDGSPATPSRLLLADAPQVVAKRILRFYPVRPQRPGRRLDLRLRPGPDPLLSDPDRWPPPPPVDAVCAEPISVTAFRDYLACPYRFALRHALKARPAQEPGPEMDGGSFGTLAHDVLKAWAVSGDQDAREEAAIGRALSGHLDRVFEHAYGRDPAPALLVQREQLRRRLASFACWQAAWAAQGWRIRHAELPVARAELAGLSPPLAIRGRMDRIDFNEGDGRWAVLDYKTADRGQTPDKVHRRSGEWVDLQLPLYRHLLTASGIGDGMPIELGYVVLSADPDETGDRLAGWSDAELASADAEALRVGAAIRAREFFPPGPPPRYDDYAALCGAEQFLELGPIDVGDEGVGP